MMKKRKEIILDLSRLSVMEPSCRSAVADLVSVMKAAGISVRLTEPDS